ncbi:MAG: hypothetical protein KUA37_06245 [Desulfomicrobium sp.]|uniref:hypothetical protein n=1 Tax=Hoeflea sp. TaxID=1940281 RepID=UPI0025C4E553|nr:hypothetical protein [Hoeflea sp.]MBV1711592.1 hypothetical protein [Desulfomicrobium sp.]MBV1782316.1 hypothetical protein [Hoeflea sp.]
MRILSEVGYMVFLMAVYYAVTHWLGAEFMANFTAFMFDDYIRLWAVHFQPMMPGFGHPAVIVILLALIVMMIPGFLRISRLAAALTIAVFVVRLAFLAFGAAGAPTPSFALATMAAFALGWLFLASAIGDGGLWGRLRGLNHAD